MRLKFPVRDGRRLCRIMSPVAKRRRRRRSTPVESVVEELDKLDGMLTEKLENWELRRVSIVDKNILRIALAELIYCPEVPEAVVIDEAIELARAFSSQDAGKFVNGVLDSLAKEVRGR